MGSREGSPRPRSDLEHEEDTTDASCSQDVLEKLKQQVASVTHGRGRKVSPWTWGRRGLSRQERLEQSARATLIVFIGPALHIYLGNQKNKSRKQNADGLRNLIRSCGFIY